MTHKTTITDNYILITSDEEIKIGDYRTNIQRGYVMLVDELHDADYFNKRNDVFKKVIAHLPLNNALKLEGVPLLPPLPSGEEKYRFTEEDMRRSFEVGQAHGSMYKGNNFNRFIQSLSQPKMPTHFKVEMESISKIEGLQWVTKSAPKIINGVMQGEWIY